MGETIDLETLGREVAQELRVLQERLAVLVAGAPYANLAYPPELPARRERERLARLERAEYRQWQERERERQARERTRPWQEQDRFGLRRRVWRERGERECALVDLRERALLDRERELADWLARHRGWLRDLAELDPAAHAWCVERARRVASGEVSVALLTETHRRWREVGAAQARALLARDDLRADLCPLLVGIRRDAATIALVIAPVLVPLRTSDGSDTPVLPVVVASVALELARPAGVDYCAGTTVRR